MPVCRPDIAQLSLWQVECALASLSKGEKIALMKIARLYARKTPYDKEDLIQGTGPVLFLGGVVRRHCLGMEERGAAGRDTLDGFENGGAQCQCRH